MPSEGVSAPGELWVRGPNVMVGYLNNAQATADTIDADGWLKTGDMATVDADGCSWPCESEDPAGLVEEWFAALR